MDPTLEQQRARNAWECSQCCTKDYVNAAKALPALIMNSGLLQVLAFCHDKGGANEQVATHLRRWLQGRFPKAFRDDEFNTVMQALMQATPADYQAIHTEAFAWLRWLRQMAAARKPGA